MKRLFSRPAKPATRVRQALIEVLESRLFLSTTNIRIVCYNVAADINGVTQVPSTQMETVLEGIGNESIDGISRPIDILALEETTSNTTTVAPIVTALNNHYGAGTYAQSPYQATEDSAGTGDGNGPNALIYNTHTMQLIASVGIGTPSGSGFPRQPVRYEFEPVGGTIADAFYVYVSHTKSGDANSGSPTNASRRNAEAQAIRADELTLPSTARVLYVGDWNSDSSSEPAIQTMLASGQGQAVDPIDSADVYGASRSWSGSSAPVIEMTESTSALDSRLDLQLMTSNVLNSSGGLEYVTGSYHGFGNNGSTPFDGQVGSANNTALQGVPNRSTILSDLSVVSDHLPLIADYTDTVTGTAPGPAIGAFAASPDPVTSGNNFTLNASSVTDPGGTITNVTFYRETNGTTGLQIQSPADTVLGNGTQNGTTWSLANVSTTGLAAGTYTYYAVATDNFGITSTTATTTETVTAATPVIASFTITPNPATSGQSITLDANVTEAGGSATGVNFYRETNGQAGLQIGSDTFLGAGTQNGDWLLSNISTSGFAVGSYTYYAVATDSVNNLTSSTASTNLNVISSLPLVNLQILGSTSGTAGTFSSSLTVTPGEQLFFEVVGQLAPIGTTNGFANKTITSLVAGTDGMNSLSYNLLDAGSNPVQVSFNSGSTLQSGFTGGSGFTAGNLTSAGGGSNNELAGARPIQAPGTFVGATSSVVVESGSLTVSPSAQLGSSSQITGSWNNILSGFKINGGSSVTAVNTSENGATPYIGYAALTLTTPALPPYITPSPGALFSWDQTTGNLTLTKGTLTFTADSTTDSVDKLINLTVDGTQGASVTFNTNQHLAGITLQNGAVATVASLGAARTHSNHNVLVIGTVAATTIPTFLIDSTSKLDLMDNDMIVHHGDFYTINADAQMGRNPSSEGPGGQLDGQWNGDGLMSSTAASVDSGVGYEQNILAVVENNDLNSTVGQYSAWTVGSFSEPLRSDGDDVIVKYTYNGDFALEGMVAGDDAGIFGLFYDNGASSGNVFAFGDTNGDGKIDGNDAGAFGLLFGLGTGGVNGAQL